MNHRFSDKSPKIYVFSKRAIITIASLASALGLLLFSAGAVLAGSLEPASGPDGFSSQMYTLDQIYIRINNGLEASKMASFSEPSAGPATGTMHTLDEIYELAGLRARVPKTGQTTSWYSDDDGAQRKGVAWPNPRFTINNDGTVTDNLTGLVWLRNANCSQFFIGDDKGQNNRSWTTAITAAVRLQSGYCNLTDGSIEGEWRLPNVRELYSLLDHQYNVPILSNTAGTGQHSDGNPFYDVQNNYYWSSTTRPSFDSWKFYVNFYDGRVYDVDGATNEFWVWPVRDPQ